MNDDLISRKAAIDEVKRLHDVAWANWKETRIPANTMIDALKELQSVQPEIIRCKDCKYQDENWRRVSVRWLPCMDVRTGSNWYCGSAERGEQ